MAIALSCGGCTENIDETDMPLAVDGQRRTDIEIECADEDCTEEVDVASAKSRDDDVLDVVEFGLGYVLVEAVGAGQTSVIVKGEGKRFKIDYEVSEGEADALVVERVETVLAP